MGSTEPPSLFTSLTFTTGYLFIPADLSYSEVLKDTTFLKMYFLHFLGTRSALEVSDCPDICGPCDKVCVCIKYLSISL